MHVSLWEYLSHIHAPDLVRRIALTARREKLSKGLGGFFLGLPVGLLDAEGGQSLWLSISTPSGATVLSDWGTCIDTHMQWFAEFLAGFLVP